VNDDPSPASAPRDLAFSPVTPAPSSPAAPAAINAAEAARSRVNRGLSLAVGVLAVLVVVAIVFAWRADQRVRGSERELVKRQQDSAVVTTEANLLARQAQEGARDAAAKVALLEARLNEVTVQRGQLEALAQSVARSRDENLVADGEATLRAGLQQGSLTGSAEPVVAALKQIEERFARANQPRLEPVRRAVARDLDRVKAASVADVATLSIKLDEAVRLVDELPLLSAAEPRRDLARGAAGAAKPASVPASASGVGDWLSREFGQAGRAVVEGAWSEVRSLVRITRIDQPEAMLVAPDQAFFLKENLKLRLLNARLSLLARQFDAARGDLRWAKGAIERYFDRSSRRTQIALDLVMNVEQQSRQSAPLRPDDTFAALAAVAR
jgi:uroporphyrin-3 C-methyltransferase